MATVSGSGASALIMSSSDFFFTSADDLLIDATGSTLVVQKQDGRLQTYVGSFQYEIDPDTGELFLAGGVIYSFSESRPSQNDSYLVDNLNLSLFDWAIFILNNDPNGFRNFVFGGNDNIFGSNGNDVLLGFAGNDALTGGQGHDYIDGGSGTADTAKFNGLRSNFQITKANGYVYVTDIRGGSPLGTDTLLNVEYLQFNDQTIDANRAPVATANFVAPAHGTLSIAATSLFTATDADSDPLQIQIFDGTIGNGQFRRQGVLQAEQQNLTFAYSDLANWQYVTSATGAGDTLWVRAYDGVAWSDWKSVVIPAHNTPVTLTVANLGPAHGRTQYDHNELFTALADPDGDTITQYRFFDGTSGNGRFVLNGVDQIENGNFDVNAAQLATLDFRTSGAGSDVLWVQAYDGYAWGAWKSFTVAAVPNRAPVVTVANINPTRGQISIAGSALLTSLGDGDGDTITHYRFFDGTIGNGRFFQTGFPQVENANFDVTAAQLVTLEFRPSGAGSDVLWVQAFDGYAWGTWKSFTVAATPNQAPVVTVSDFTPAQGDSAIAAAALFAVTDGDGDAIMLYRFFDGTSGSGKFQLNGIDQAALQNITVVAADLANFRYVPGGGGDVLWVQAYDGASWGTWKSFTAGAPQGTAPAVIAPDRTPAHGTATIAAANLFALSAPDGATITHYRFFDGTSGNGRFVLSGVDQVENVNLPTIAAADLGNLSFRTSGAGGDVLWVQASTDGTTWGAWKSFTVNPPLNTGPTVSAVDFTPHAGVTSVGVSTLFSVSDAEGDTVTRYRLFDGTIGRGRLLRNGTPEIENANIEITAAQLADFTFQTSAAGGDLLWVQAYDGASWGAWKSFTVGAPQDVAPSVTGISRSVAPNFAVAAASLFSASDANKDTITQYQFWDSTAGGGSFRIGGVAQGTNVGIDVMAAQLATTDFLTGATPGTDQLWVRANDGSAWGEWKTFNVTTLAT